MRHAIWFLRILVLAIALIVLIMGTMLLPEIWRESSAAAAIAGNINPLLSYTNFLLIGGLYGATIPFYRGVFRTLQLLSLIQSKRSFSENAVAVLASLKRCAFAVCSLYMVGVMPMAYVIAELSDGPGFIIIVFLIGLSPLVVSILATILQKLLEEAIHMKTENELTI